MAKNISGVPVRRVSAEFTGDDAIDIEVIEVSLGLSRAVRSKVDKDALLMKYAIAALNSALTRYKSESGEKYPEADRFGVWLGIAPESGRAVDEDVKEETKGIPSGVQETNT